MIYVALNFQAHCATILPVVDDCGAKCNHWKFCRGRLKCAPHCSGFRMGRTAWLALLSVPASYLAPCPRSLKYKGWLWPESLLYRFLCTRPSIKELLEWIILPLDGCLPCSSQFLPSLQVLGCLRVATALQLTTNPFIHTLSVSDGIFYGSGFDFTR